MSGIKRFFNRWMANPFVFFSLVFFVTFLQSEALLGALRFELGRIYPYLWLGGFVILAFNISLILVQSLYALWVEDPLLPEVNVEDTRNPLRIAMLVCVKNEGEETLERIRYSLQGNSGVDFWLLSDSEEGASEKEQEWVRILREEFGERIFYRHRAYPLERKQGNLAEWFETSGKDYEYFFVLDADSTLPEGTVEKLIRKAEHPANQDIGIFQSAIYIAHDHSLFARAASIGQYYAQRLYFRVNQAVFGRSVSFGHNQLVRSSAFRKIKLPEGVLSHDNWDTALLDRVGYRTAFVSDSVSFEEAAQNYLEERSRAKRWMKGSLQGWPILFMSGITFPTRFFIFYQIYLYLVQPVLLAWTLLGLVWGSRWFQIGLFLEGGEAMKPVVTLLAFTFLVLFGHKFLLVRSLGDLKRIAFEILVSTLVSLNNIFYVTWDFLALPFERLQWLPMRKDPNARVSLQACVRKLLPGTLFGLGAFLWGTLYSPYWTLPSLPIVASLILSIPAVYFTSRDWVLESDDQAFAEGGVF